MNRYPFSDTTMTEAFRLGQRSGLVAGIAISVGVALVAKTAQVVGCERYGYVRKVKYTKNVGV